MYISPLSYFYIQQPGPTYELLEQTLPNMDARYVDYFQSIHVSSNHPPVYAIQKHVHSSNYEYEVYYYMYRPNRMSPLDIVIDPHWYEDPYIPSIIAQKKIHLEADYLIASINIHEAFFKGSKEVQFYFGITYNDSHELQDSHHITYIDDKPYPFFCVIEHDDGTMERTNIYGNAEVVCSDYNQTYCHKDTIVFYTKKRNNVHGYYYERITYDAFLRFLEDFNYDTSFIQFCKTQYDDTFYFSVGYDEKDGQVLRSAIYGIFM